MRIDSLSATTPSPQLIRRQANENVQSVFSEVLAAVGRQGFESAKPIESEQPLNEQITGSWSDWFHASPPSRYQNVGDLEAFQQSYGALLVQAHQEGGYADPAAFLQGLSKTELKVVQRVHSLADPIDVNSLTEEGSLNLLLPPPGQIDVNRDGLTQVGRGYSIRFPDSTTPPKVRQAWDDATADLDARDLMHYELQMKLPVLLANIRLDAKGAFVEAIEPGDPRFVNPMASPDYDYVGATQDHLDYLKEFKPRIDPLRYERSTAFWRRFQNELTADPTDESSRS